MLNLHNTILRMYNPEATESDDSDDNITKIRDLLNWADTLVLGSPDYNGSISDVLKDFLDYYLNELAGKTFGYLCASHEKGLDSDGPYANSSAPMLWLEYALWRLYK